MTIHPPLKKKDEFVLRDADRPHLEKLPQQQRQLLKLRHDEGLSYDVIAGIAVIPIGTVKSRINRGRAAIEALRAKAAVVEEVMQQPSMQAGNR